MVQDIDARTAQTLHLYEHSRDNDWPYLCAVGLGDLIEAKDRGLIEETGVDVEEATSYVAARLTSVEQMWRDNFSQLHRIVSFPGGLVYEEVVLVLTLRSNLESAGRFLGEESRRRLREELDPQLSESLRGSRSPVAELQSRGSAGLESVLPSHWWWRDG